MPRSSPPVTVTLGDLHEKVQERIRSGAFASTSEVVRAGLRALDREEEALNAVLRARIEAALADPRPSEAAEDVFKALRARHAQLNRTHGEDL